jgi:hypothetical protein
MAMEKLLEIAGIDYLYRMSHPNLPLLHWLVTSFFELFCDWFVSLLSSWQHGNFSKELESIISFVHASSYPLRSWLNTLRNRIGHRCLVDKTADA